MIQIPNFTDWRALCFVAQESHNLDTGQPSLLKPGQRRTFQSGACQAGLLFHNSMPIVSDFGVLWLDATLTPIARHLMSLPRASASALTLGAQTCDRRYQSNRIRFTAA
jgi:hypothetical protein